MLKKKISFTGKAVLAVILALLLADSVLGIVLIRQSRAGMKEMIDARMLDIANTAAAMVDGDTLKSLRAEDANSSLYRHIYNQLKLFQQNIALEYIYCIGIGADGSFTFSVDPAPDPGDFGSPVVVTPALIRASQGVASVDDEPYEDAWGSFYSAYSPIYDSRGNVAGLLAVDFDAHWYQEQLRRDTVIVLVLSTLSVLLGAGIAALVTRGLRRRFDRLGSELSGLAKDMEALTQEIARSARGGFRPEPGGGALPADDLPGSYDEIDALGGKIRSMQAGLRDYLAYAHARAYIDGLTGVGNKTAYLEMSGAMEQRIADGTAAFSLTIFDIDDLKGVNDNLGHEKGDSIICGAARAIAAGFGSEHLYRIGGDEFIAVRAGAGEAELAAWGAALEAELARVRAEAPDLPLAISWGSAVYDGALDPDYRSVFRRADEAMYSVKSERHRLHPSARSPEKRASDEPQPVSGR